MGGGGEWNIRPLGVVVHRGDEVAVGMGPPGVWGAEALAVAFQMGEGLAEEAFREGGAPRGELEVG